MNEGHFHLSRIFSLTTSGILILWYFFDVNISEYDFIKNLQIKDERLITYILVFVIILSTVDSILELDKIKNKSWQSIIQITVIVLLSISAIIITYPKIVYNAASYVPSRLDIIVPLLLSFFVASFANILNHEIVTFLVFYKFRKTILPVQIFSFCIIIFLIILCTISVNHFNEELHIYSFYVQNTIFIAFFLIFFFLFSPRNEIYSKEEIEFLAKQTDALDREVEVNQYVANLRNPPVIFKKRLYKKIMNDIARSREEKIKSIYPRFKSLKKLKFKPEGTYFMPVNNDIDDEETVLIVEMTQKKDGQILETEYIKYKYIRQACQKIASVSPGNDLRGFLIPMYNKAYELYSLKERDKNEVMLSLSGSDDNLILLKDLFNSRFPDINYADPGGWSALLISIVNNAEKTTKYLLQKAADTSISTKFGATPLHFACQYGNSKLAELLLNFHADANQKDVYGRTPLMLAAKFGHSAIVKILIQNGAETNIYDDQNKTALSYSVEAKHGEIARYLKGFMKQNIK